MDRFGYHLALLIDQFDTFSNYASVGLAAFAFVGKADLHMHSVVGKDGLHKANLVPSEGRDRGVFVKLELRLQALHQSESI